MIDLRLKRGGAFGVGCQRPLDISQDRSQLGEAPFNGRIELRVRALGGAFSNGLL
jgi:hypothetical protein